MTKLYYFNMWSSFRATGIAFCTWYSNCFCWFLGNLQSSSRTIFSWEELLSTINSISSLITFPLVYLLRIIVLSARIHKQLVKRSLSCGKRICMENMLIHISDQGLNDEHYMWGNITRRFHYIRFSKSVFQASLGLCVKSKNSAP